ncbi:MAG: protein translocase subunit SecF [Candidatus Saganbacteria bacterium]|nr:protein translocase subunit SecF [Candidatus Saganbacteria bacterium]
MDIIGKSKIWLSISLTVIVIAVVVLLSNAFFRGKPLNFGIDFTGGSLITVKFEEKDVSEGELRKVFADFGYPGASIQKTGPNVLSIRLEPIEVETRTKMMDEMQKLYGKVDLLEADIIGPVIGKELATQAIWALIAASVLITIYISFRFEFKYAMAALLALYHDAIIVIGISALLWRNVEIPFIAAILTILGYSINDTVVIFDRIRENMKKTGSSKKNFAALVNESIMQTMSRSINTVATVVVVTAALLIFGGATLKDFYLILLIGFICGAYSSIFIASPLLVMWEKGSTTKK